VSYSVELRGFGEIFPVLEPLLRQHYAEMAERMRGLGMEVSPYKPRWEQYRRASEGGWLLTFLLWSDDTPVGDAMVYITNDMHNGDLIAQEDTIYVLPEHRRGAGRLLANAVHEELRRRGVKRLNVTTSTDLRVARWLERQGYKHVAHCMSLSL
jgi:GNAT superfamily N-acetyltransferase